MKGDQDWQKAAPPKAVPWLVLLVVVILAGIALWKWSNDDESAGPERGVTVEDVAESDAFEDDGFADDFLGRQVTVSGNVSEIVSSDAIRLGGDDFGGDGILIIGVTTANISEGQDVRITGTVREFDPIALQREFGSAAFNDHRYGPWKDENVLVASTTSRLSNQP